MNRWHEIVEDGVYEFHRDFDGVVLTITRLNIPEAWACVLQDAKRVIGELRDVKKAVELFMDSRDSATSVVPRH